jgi:hypothetical protein
MGAILKTTSADKIHIDKITKQFFDLFNNTNHKQPEWKILDKICIAETIIIKKTGVHQTIYDLASFIEPRKSILTNGTLTDFHERELYEETKIVGHIAQRNSKYQKTGNLNGTYFVESGTKLFQFIKTIDGWKINSLIWEDNQLYKRSC